MASRAQPATPLRQSALIGFVTVVTSPLILSKVSRLVPIARSAFLALAAWIAAGCIPWRNGRRTRWWHERRVVGQQISTDYEVRGVIGLRCASASFLSKLARIALSLCGAIMKYSNRSAMILRVHSASVLSTLIITSSAGIRFGEVPAEVAAALSC